ncbi:hypothetical protein CHS0354_004164 [Potamilus streckersoni]|uniref:Nucleotide-diphospho-sugar transferase domain-containing protein n=1 Tax=Potamilus streckersoni TaxID=2493646 RepID=A0AAE0T0D7_9BIVA|nr:hypothetical protein CHS0354_004164 [Potamilus streckersoni]
MHTGGTFNVFQRYREVCKTSYGDRCRHWTSRLLPVFLFSSFILYLFLYSNIFDSISIPLLFQTIKGDPTAIWNRTLGSLSDFKNLSSIRDFHLRVPLIRSSTDLSPTSNPSSPPPIIQITEKRTSSIWTERIFKLTTDQRKTPPVQIIQQNISSPWKERIRELTKNQTKPLLTLFTSWTDDEDKYLVHNLTTLNWLSLRPFVMPIIFTNETALARVCESAGWVVLPLRVTAADGIPVLKYMYIDVMRRFESNFYAYANSDILFTDTLVVTLTDILKTNSALPTSDVNNSTSQDCTLIVGRRTNVNNITMEEGLSWSEITKVAKERGSLFQSNAEDYFITSSLYPWNDIPEIVIGRRAYDNWLVLNARKQKHQVIDATNTILAVHQTTKHGNYEGMAKKTTDYNHNLLVSLYKKIQYGWGFTECVEYQTTVTNGYISISSRKLPMYCVVK